jgi:hypothetical protein
MMNDCQPIDNRCACTWSLRATSAAAIAAFAVMGLLAGCTAADDEKLPAQQGPTQKSAATQAKAQPEKAMSLQDFRDSSVGKLKLLRIMIGDNTGGTIATDPWNLNRGPAGLLLASPALQEELRLNAEQKKKLAEVSRARAEKVNELWQKFYAESKRGGSARSIDFKPQEEALRRDAEKLFAELLDERQKTRVSQILLQIRGPLAVADPQVAGQIGLTPEQLQAVQQIKRGMMEEQQSISVASNDRAARAGELKRVADPNAPNGVEVETGGYVFTPQSYFIGNELDCEKIREQAGARIAKVLQKPQWTEFNRLLGEPIDLSTLLPDEAANQNKKKGE